MRICINGRDEGGNPCRHNVDLTRPRPIIGGFYELNAGFCRYCDLESPPMHTFQCGPTLAECPQECRRRHGSACNGFAWTPSCPECPDLVPRCIMYYTTSAHPHAPLSRTISSATYNEVLTPWRQNVDGDENNFKCYISNTMHSQCPQVQARPRPRVAGFVELNVGFCRYCDVNDAPIHSFQCGTTLEDCPALCITRHGAMCKGIAWTHMCPDCPGNQSRCVAYYGDEQHRVEMLASTVDSTDYTEIRMSWRSLPIGDRNGYTCYVKELHQVGCPDRPGRRLESRLMSFPADYP